MKINTFVKSAPFPRYIKPFSKKIRISNIMPFSLFTRVTLWEKLPYATSFEFFLFFGSIYSTHMVVLLVCLTEI